MAKQTGELDAAQARMLPGVLTLDGFLGHDKRSLAEILAADDAEVKKLGCTHARIAEALASLTEQGRDIGERETLVGSLGITVRDDRGLISSPWEDGVFEKGETVMRDTKTGATFRWNQLTIHLIRVHGFYSGQGSAYRLEPAAIATVAGVKA